MLSQARADSMLNDFPEFPAYKVVWVVPVDGFHKAPLPSGKKGINRCRSKCLECLSS